MIPRVFSSWNKLTRYLYLRRDPVGYARSIGVRVGDGCRFIGLQLGTFGSEPYLVRLGNHVTITSGVRFITHDGGVWVFRQKHPDIEILAPIVIGDNVFVGLNTIIMPGVAIGENSVIGAGSVVTRDIPSNSIAVGVPARCIKSTDEYWESIKDKASYTRSLPQLEKQRLFEQRFWGDKS